MAEIKVYNVCSHYIEDCGMSSGRTTSCCVAFHPCNVNRFATGGGDNTIFIWEFSNNKSGLEQQSKLDYHTKSINILCWNNNDGKYLASGGTDEMIVIWEFDRLNNNNNNAGNGGDGDIFNEMKHFKEKWTVKHKFRGNFTEITDIIWSNDNNYIISSSLNGIFVICDVKRNKIIQEIDIGRHYIQGICLDKNNQILVLQSMLNNVKLYINKSNKKNKFHFKYLKSIQYYPNNNNNNINGNKKSSLFASNVVITKKKPNWSPDGIFLCCVSGLTKNKKHGIHLFHRSNLFNKITTFSLNELCHCSCIKWNPLLLKANNIENNSIMFKYKMKYKMLFSCICENNIFILDTSKNNPILYWRDEDIQSFIDMEWSFNGKILLLSDAEGFITKITLNDDIINEYKPTKSMDIDHE